MAFPDELGLGFDSQKHGKDTTYSHEELMSVDDAERERDIGSDHCEVKRKCYKDM